MFAAIRSAALRGIDSYPVRVEVSFTSGLPSFSIVGLAQGAVRESRERVVSALKACGHPPPPKRITVNLAPAGVRKGGTHYDLPLAVGLLAGAGVVPGDELHDLGFIGELGLDGTLRPVPGVLPLVEGLGCRAVVVPCENAREAAAFGRVRVLSARTLGEVVNHLTGVVPLSNGTRRRRSRTSDSRGGDFSDVRGQEAAKRALEIAAAGGHNVLMVGPPGAGKTMLARRLPSILPPLDRSEALEVTRVHSVAGLVEPGAELLRDRPFRAPHHSVSEAGLIGGGSPLPRPGEVTLAHRGVLFLDELPEYRRGALESLREPLEEGQVALFRAAGGFRYPARFLLVGAMNPCPCGYSGSDARPCVCPEPAIDRYRAKVSGPLLDRIDIHLRLGAVPVEKLRLADGPPASEGSAEIRRRVVGARDRQAERFRGSETRCNARMSLAQLTALARPEPAVQTFVERAVERLSMSARAYHRILRVARTIADLAGAAEVRPEHAAEAIQYRMLDRAA